MVLKKKYKSQLTRELSRFYLKSVDDSLPYIQRYNMNITKAMMKMTKVFQYSKTNFPKNEKLIGFTKACLDNLKIHDRDLKVLTMDGDALKELKKTSFGSYIKEITNYTETKLNPYKER